MAVYRYGRKGKWMVDIRHRDLPRGRHRRLSPVNTREGAIARETTLRWRIAHGEPIEGSTPTDKKPFEEFAWEWFNSYVKANNKLSEQHMKESTLRAHLLPAFGRLPISEVGGRVIEEYKATKLAAGLHPKTVSNHLAILRRLLNSAAEWHVIAVAPRIHSLRFESHRIDFLSDAEIVALLNASAETQWSLPVRLALRTGLRLGEILALAWSEVDLPRCQVTVARSAYRRQICSTKNGRIREVPLTADLVDAFDSMEHRTGLVFQQGGVDMPRHPETARRALHRRCRASGIRRVGWHTLRHTFASHLVMRGVPLRHIQQLLGHQSIVMTERYAHLAPSTLRCAVDLLLVPLPDASGQQLGNAPPAESGTHADVRPFSAQQTREAAVGSFS